MRHKRGVPTYSHRKLQALFARVNAEQPVAIAVSGGGDSMALLHLVLNRLGSPSQIHVLTVDHALREGSAREARQVKRWCQNLGVRHTTLKWKHATITTGLQARARAARYALMAAWCKKHAIQTLLTAHTAEDQAETVAMRRQRTSSHRSLAAIWPEVKTEDGLRIIRPLLAEKRADLRAYLTDQHQPWLEDPSNHNPTFERVRIRQSKPDLALAHQAERAQRRVVKAQEQAARWCAKHLHITPFGMMHFSLAPFGKLKPDVADASLCHMLNLAGGKQADAANRARLIRWLQGDESPAATLRRTLGGALFARRKREVIVAREPGRIAAMAQKLRPGHTLLWDGRFEVRGPQGSTVIPAFMNKDMKYKGEIPAFVRAGWPVVVRRGQILATPLHSFDAAAEIAFKKK